MPIYRDAVDFLVAALVALALGADDRDAHPGGCQRMSAGQAGKTRADYDAIPARTWWMHLHAGDDQVIGSYLQKSQSRWILDMQVRGS